MVQCDVFRIAGLCYIYAMEFNEYVHAFISAKYYALLTKEYGARGTDAFRQMTVLYGKQRGIRMAKRALRDGQPLTYETYMNYREWVPSADLPLKAIPAKVSSLSPDYQIRIYSCAWHEQFVKMGLAEAGRVYCRVIDPAICAGFNPDLTFITSQTLNDHDCCIQTVKNAFVSPEYKSSIKTENTKDFEYHCAHLFETYRRGTSEYFGDTVNQSFLSSFRETYGNKMTERILSYQETDFEETA